MIRNPVLDGVQPGDRVGDGGGPPGDPVEKLRPEPPVRGETVLAAIDRGFAFADRWIGRVVPARWNPLAHTGAIASVALMVAVVTGIPLLFWYVPSVHQAHASLEHMGLAGRLVRSLHRYSSDLCMMFAALHALRLFAARRFAGARWLAWMTGVLAVALL